MVLVVGVGLLVVPLTRVEAMLQPPPPPRDTRATLLPRYNLFDGCVTNDGDDSDGIPIQGMTAAAILVAVAVVVKVAT